MAVSPPPVWPTVTICAGIVFAAVGALFTVAVKVCVVVAFPSLAVTVIVGAPGEAFAVKVTIDPDRLTPTFVSSEELAV